MLLVREMLKYILWSLFNCSSYSKFGAGGCFYWEQKLGMDIFDAVLFDYKEYTKPVCLNAEGMKKQERASFAHSIRNSFFSLHPMPNILLPRFRVTHTLAAA